MIRLTVAVRLRIARLARAVRARALAAAAWAQRLELWATRDLNRLSSLQHARLAACSVCPAYGRTLPGVCAECHCFMPLKTQFPAARCPIGKW